MAEEEEPVLFVLPPVDLAPEHARSAREKFCLHAGMCMRDFFGYGACTTECDSQYVQDLKDGVMSSLMASLIERVPRALRKSLLERVKGVYFGP